MCVAVMGIACAVPAMFAQTQAQSPSARNQTQTPTSARNQTSAQNQAQTPAASQTPPQAPPPQLTEDDAAVYTALFHTLYEAAKGRPIVLSDQTARGVPPGMMANITVEGIHTERFLSKVPQEAKADFELQNKQSLHFPSPCKLAPECIVANLADLAPYTKDERAWKGFFKKYPNTPGIVVVSRIGFNADHTAAVVYAGHSCGRLCGQGEFTHLVKRDGAWAVEDRTIVWISEK
jgi:hypothetical protein